MAYPILAPNSTWYKSSVARNTITQINIVDSYTPTGSENESWNADVNNSGSIKCYRTGTVVTMAGNGTGRIMMNADSSSAFASFTKLQTITGGNVYDTSNVTSFVKTFQLCSKLESVDVSTWDTSKVTTMNRMFQAASLIGNLDVSNWNVSNVTDMNGVFNMPEEAYYNTRLTSLNTSNWNTGKVTTMRNLFFGCTALTTVETGGWDVSKVTDLRGSFSGTAITSLDVSNWDTSSCTDMGWMFYGTPLKTLDVSKWDVSKVTSFHHMFAWCTSLVPYGVENWDTSSAQYMDAMFHSNSNTTLDLSGWDVSNVKDFAQMFERNIYLTEIKGLENWDTSSGQIFGDMFLGCQSLKELNLSSFDTRKASASFYDEIRGQTYNNCMVNMFGRRLIGEDKATEEYGWMMRLEKITLGENFSFNGDGTATPAVLPTPDATYIDGADGNWYDSTGTSYSISTITVPNTYYAFKALALGHVGKVEYYGKVLIDLTEDNVTEDVVPEGITFHDKTGAPKTGTFTLATEMSEQDSLIDQIQRALRGKAAGGGSGGTDTRFKELAEGTLTEIDDNTITTTRAYAFYYARSLERVNLPNVTSLGSYSFNSCESLVSINLPNVTSAIPTYCFSSCRVLKHVNVPNATGANNYSFQDCEGLEKVELGHATTIGSYAFRRSGVTALIIRNTTSKLTNLSSTNAFAGCPIEDGTGYIYFYRQYVEDYKAKTGWTAYADQIRAIEDYPEICGGA